MRGRDRAEVAAAYSTAARPPLRAGERVALLATRTLGPWPITLAECAMLVPFLALVLAPLTGGDRVTAVLLIWLVVIFCALLGMYRLLGRPASGRTGPRRSVSIGQAVVSALFFLLAGYTVWLFALLGLWVIVATLMLRAGDATAKPLSPARLLRAALPAPLVAGVVAATVGRWVIGAVIFLAAPKHQVDFAIYYAAALALHHNPHANIYDLALLRATARMAPGAFIPDFPYLYPPVLALLLQPLTLVAPRTAALIWTLFNLFLWLASTILLVDWIDRPLRGADADMTAGGLPRRAPLWRWRQLPAATRLAMLLAALLALGYVALDHTVFIGQVSGLILFLILLVPWLLQRRRAYLAGAVLALAVAIKLFPIVLIAYFVARRQWRVVGGAVGGLALLGAATLASGISPALMVRGILDNGAAQQVFYNNQALSQAPLWIAVELGGGASPLTTLLGYALLALVALAFAGALFGVWRRGATLLPHAGPAAGAGDWLGYAWAICAMLLVAPITWEHHDAWLLPPIALGLGYGLRALASGVRRQARDRLKPEMVIVEALALAYLLTMQALPFDYDANHVFALGPLVLGHPVRPFVMLLRPLSALLVWGAVGALWWRDRRQSASPNHGREPTDAVTSAAPHRPIA